MNRSPFCFWVSSFWQPLGAKENEKETVMTPWGGGSAHLSDEQFVEAFESCRLPKESFHHADHIRLAWIYLRRMPESEAAGGIAESIQRLAAHYGLSDKFHVTMTRAWTRLVAAALTSAPPDMQFPEFAAAHPHLLDKNLLEKHYSSESLRGDEARSAWLEPDLRPLP